MQDPSLCGGGFAQSDERIAPRVVVAQRTQLRAHVGDPLRTTRGSPAVKLKIQADIGVELIPTDIERAGRGVAVRRRHRLLRACHNWPRDCRTTERSNEIPSPHELSHVQRIAPDRSTYTK